MKGGYLQYNGKFLKESDLLFSGGDLFRLGVGLHESFRAENNEILFAEEVYEHLNQAARAINLPLPEGFDIFGVQFRRDVSRLLNKNKLYLAARVVVHLFAGSNGTDILMSAEELPRGFFPLSANGLLLNIFTDETKAIGKLGNCEPGSRYIWMVAANTAATMSRHNMIICNSDNFPCEVIGGSFAIIRESTITFPSAESGGYQATIVAQVANAARQCGFEPVFRENIGSEELLEADELFLMDNCLGIQKVLGLEERRFYSIKTEAIARKFTELATEYRKSRML